MKAILINPWDKTIQEVEVQAEKFLPQVYALLSEKDAHKVLYVEPLHVGDSQVLLIDDDIMMKMPLPDARFYWHTQLIWGKALAVTMGEEDFTGTGLTVEYVTNLVRWA